MGKIIDDQEQKEQAPPQGAHVLHRQRSYANHPHSPEIVEEMLPS